MMNKASKYKQIQTLQYQTHNFACFKPSWALSSQILQPKGKKSVQMSCVEISIDSIKLANFSCDMATYQGERYILLVVWFTHCCFSVWILHQTKPWRFWDWIQFGQRLWESYIYNNIYNIHIYMYDWLWLYVVYYVYDTLSRTTGAVKLDLVLPFNERS